MAYRTTSLAPLALSGIPSVRWSGVEGPCMSYQLRPDDILWMARAAQCEGGDPVATMWTWIQRFMYRTCQGTGAGTLADEIRTHSQPVNPIWQRNGSKCRPGGQYHGQANCSEARLQTREECSSRDWDDIDPEIRAIAQRFGQGQVRNTVPGAVDFAVPDLVQAAVARKPGSRIVLRAGNWYMTFPETNDWDDEVHFVGGRANPRTVALGATLPLLAIAATVGVYYAVKRAA